MKRSQPAPLARRLCALAAAAVLAAALALPALAAPAASSAARSDIDPEDTPAAQTAKTSVTAPLALPVALANEDESVYLYNMDNRTVLLDYNSTESRYVASTTKMMTALLLLESDADLYAEFTIADGLAQEFKTIQDYNGADMGLKTGETVRLIDLLYGLLVRSANDAASVIAWQLSGGNIQSFVAQMNQRAAELGCTGTAFSCPHGLYDAGNLSTAQDLARIAEACYAQPLYMEVAETLSYTLPATNKHKNERTIENVNLMMQPDQPYYRAYIRGMKTGFTTLAGRCFVTTATQNGATYLLVVLGSTKDSIYAECAGILDWAFDSFSDRVLLDPAAEVAQLPLKGCDEAETVSVYAARSVAAYGLNTDEVTLELDLPETVRAPVKAGEVIGTAAVYLGGQYIDTVDLVAGQAYASAFLSGLWNTVLLAPILAAVLLALGLFTLRLGGRAPARPQR